MTSCAGLGRAERRADAGRPAADHQHVGRGREHRLTRRQSDRDCARGSRQRWHHDAVAFAATLPFTEWLSRRSAISLFCRARARNAGSARRMRRLELAPAVPRVVDVGDQPAGADLLERRHVDAEVLEKAADLGRIGQGHERHVLQAREDQEVQAHADREREMLHQRQELPRRVLALQHARALRAQHLRDDGVACCMSSILGSIGTNTTSAS